VSPERQFVPDPAEIEALVTKRTRAIVVINPNNPSGAVYPRAVLEAIARIAEKHHLVVLADEIYDQMTYDGAEFVPMATLVHHTLCGTLSGCRRSIGPAAIVWVGVFSGDLENAREYLSALELLSSLRLCSNVPGQWAVQTALGGYQSIRSWSHRRSACTSRAAPSSRRCSAAAISRSQRHAVRCTLRRCAVRPAARFR
jgi:alanine-synthesizing transaminase